MLPGASSRRHKVYSMHPSRRASRRDEDLLSVAQVNLSTMSSREAPLEGINKAMTNTGWRQAAKPSTLQAVSTKAKRQKSFPLKPATQSAS